MTRLRPGRFGVRLPVEPGDLSSVQKASTGTGYPSNVLFSRDRGSIWGVKRPGSETDHSPPPKAKVKH